MQTEPTKAFYDKKYTNYIHPTPQTILERIYLLLKRYELHRNDAAVQLLKPGKTFLDIGTGSGDLIVKASKIGFKNLYGIDISNVVIESCNNYLKKTKVTAKLTVQNIDKATNFRENIFDAVTMIAVFEHVFDPHSVLTEIHRILKYKGQLIIEVPNVVFLPRRLSFLLGKLPKTADEPNYEDGHLQFYTQESLMKLLQSHGFEVSYVGSSGIGYKMRNIWSSLLGANIVISANKI